MVGWLCREPFKATNTINFAQGRLARASTTDGGRELLRVLTQKRGLLFDQLAQLQHDARSTDDAFNSYISLLLGLIHSSENAPRHDLDEDEANIGKDKSRAKRPYDRRSLNVAHSSVIFKYTDNTSGKTEAQADLYFELSNAIMNYGLWHMKHASWLENFSAPEGEREDTAKAIFLSLKTAAGVFKYLLDKHLEALEYRPNTDFDERMLSARYEQCLAEAQEGVLERARTLQHRPELIASIAADEYRRFQVVADNMSSMSSNRTARHFHKYFQFKASFYKAYMWLFYGKHLAEQEEVGKAIRCLQDAEGELTASVRLVAEYTRDKCFSSVQSSSATAEGHTIMSTIRKTITSEKSRLERENGLIYHKQVPKASVEEPASRECIEMIAFLLPEPDMVWNTHTFEWDRIPKIGIDPVADKASNDGANVRPTPFDSHGKPAGDSLCSIS